MAQVDGFPQPFASPWTKSLFHNTVGRHRIPRQPWRTPAFELPSLSQRCGFGLMFASEIRGVAARVSRAEGEVPLAKQFLAMDWLRTQYERRNATLWFIVIPLPDTVLATRVQSEELHPRKAAELTGPSVYVFGPTSEPDVETACLFCMRRKTVQYGAQVLLITS